MNEGEVLRAALRIKQVMRFFFRSVSPAKLRRSTPLPCVDDPFMRKVWHRVSGKSFSGYRCNRNAFPARKIRYVVVVTEIEHGEARLY